jgi:hypothetical protein
MTVLEHAAACTLDCPGTCSLTVTVEGGRIAKVRGSDAPPYSLCWPGMFNAYFWLDAIELERAFHGA